MNIRASAGTSTSIFVQHIFLPLLLTKRTHESFKTKYMLGKHTKINNMFCKILKAFLLVE